jgi:hypothetical protein
MWPVMVPFAECIESSAAPQLRKSPVPGLPLSGAVVLNFPPTSLLLACLLAVAHHSPPERGPESPKRECCVNASQGPEGIAARTYEYAKCRQAGHLPKMPEGGW